jgi:cyanophycinase
MEKYLKKAVMKGIRQTVFRFILLSAFLIWISNVGVASGKKPAGKLFIIGGGSRPDVMIERLIDEAGVRSRGYVFILPMASEEADSAIIWSGEQFKKKGIQNVTGYNFKSGIEPERKMTDSLENASLIYISGGVQSRFMKSVEGTPLFSAIHHAYQRGAVIAGTSAGAAVMASQMITGNELRYPQYFETFKRIEIHNIEFEKGLGLIQNAFIDQHFVMRSRHNRLLTAVLENPEIPGIGIDEATAILVKGNHAEVVGNSQVLVFRNKNKKKVVSGNKLGARNIILDIYLPGDKFLISK